MQPRILATAAALAAAIVLGQATPSQAQWGYPGGFGGFGWGGWGGGVGTVQGDIAQGMGAFAAGAGFYNKQTAVANSINADTVMRWNQYMWESQVTANRAQRERMARRASTVRTTREAIETRLRENPEPRDIFQGDALNLAVEEINNPRVYSKALAGAKAKVGGDVIRDIPFQYAPGAITVSIHQLTRGTPPAALMAPAFDTERTELKAIGQKIRAELDEGKVPDEAIVNRALELIHAAETKADSILKAGTRDRTEVDRYLKALHGLVAMLRTPALDVILSGVEKQRPEATLGELLAFMGAFNLRFGPASTPRQRTIYTALFRQLDQLRDEIAPALADASTPKSSGTEPGEFFSGMSYDDLKKKAPAPPKPSDAPK